MNEIGHEGHEDHEEHGQVRPFDRPPAAARVSRDREGKPGERHKGLSSRSRLTRIGLLRKPTGRTAFVSFVAFVSSWPPRFAAAAIALGLTVGSSAGRVTEAQDSPTMRAMADELAR